MRFLGQRWDYREDKWCEIGTTDQLVTLNGEYSGINTAIKYRFQAWADGKIIRILYYPGDSIYGEPLRTYYLLPNGTWQQVQPVPVYEMVNDWTVELFHTEFLAWGYPESITFYEPTKIWFKPDPNLDLCFSFDGKVPDLADRGLHPVEKWRKVTWGWRLTNPEGSSLNWDVADTPDQCLLDALKWCKSQDYGSTSGWVYHGHYEPMVHAMQRIKVRTQDDKNGTTWTDFDMSKVPAPVAERIARIPKEST